MLDRNSLLAEKAALQAELSRKGAENDGGKIKLNATFRQAGFLVLENLLA
jgi:hypothetical protein